MQDRRFAAGPLQRRLAAAAHRDQGRYADAVAELRAAAHAAPGHADVHAELGLTFSQMGDPASAEAAYRQALALRPDDLDSQTNLASTLQQLGRVEEAEAVFRAVLQSDPRRLPALRNFAVLLKDAGRHAESRTLALRAAELDSSLDVAVQAHLALTPMVRSAQDIAGQRAAYAAGLETLDATPTPPGAGMGRANLPWYYLAYHADDDDLALLVRTGEVMRGKIGVHDADLAGWRGPAAEGRRIRIAVCSEFLHSHTIGRLFGGLIRELDRTRFETVLLHGAFGRADALRADLDRAADQALVLPADVAAACRAVRKAAPDILLYPDIGMSAQTYALALSRLAPVQATSWGHPVTSGLASIDYFVSADGIEPEGAEATYAERLIRLGRLPCAYDAPPSPPAAPREALDLPAQGTLYGCPQTLFKFHPDFDAALAAIADGDPDGRIVLIGAHNPGWTEVLKARWAAAHPRLLERAIFLRRLTHEGFMAHLAHIDVLLDPFHFGSGNTLYEGLACGKPIVTWPGRAMRGRIVAGAYAQMGVDDAPVAASQAAYPALAVALGRDPARRQRLAAELKAKASGLYGDRAAVAEFEAFAIAAVAAAERGELLPPGWRPGPA